MGEHHHADHGHSVDHANGTSGTDGHGHDNILLHCGIHEHHVHHCFDNGLPANLVLAYVMMGFVVFDLCILYLVNWSNVFVRSATYKMLCMSISVYCAVLLNTALMECFEQLSSLIHRDIEITFGLMIFLGTYLSLFFLCRHFKDKHRYLMAFESLGGHLIAFAGIVAFGNMLFSCWFENSFYKPVVGSFGVESQVVSVKYLFVIGFVSLGLLLLFGLFRYWRRKTYLHEHWVEEVSGAENEASALIFGFLVLQTSVLIVTGKQPSLHDHTCRIDHLKIQAGFLFLIGVALLIALFLVSFAKSRLLGDKNTKIPSFNLRRALAMSAGYCMERASKWMIISHWDDEEVAHVLSAFSLSFFSVAAVFCLTYVMRIDNETIKQDKEKQRAEVLKAIFEAFAVLIGLGWDHAFEVCETQIVHQFNKRIDPSLSKLFLALALCGVVVPGWALYILPAARKSLQEHMETVEQTNEQYDRLNLEPRHHE